MKKLLILISLILAFSVSISAQKKWGKFIDKQALISNGQVKSTESFKRFGNNANVGSTEEDIWSNGGVYPFPTTLEYLRVAAGGGVADSITGTGARMVIVQYLDSLWNRDQDTLTLHGAAASPDSTTNKAWRLIRAWVYQTGTYGGNNTDTIIIENAATNQVLGSIATGIGQTEMSMYTVPRGETAFVRSITIQVGTANNANVSMWQRQNADVVVAPFCSKRIVLELSDIQGEYIEQQVHYPTFAEMTDIWFSSVRTGGQDAQVSITYDILLIDN